MKTRLKSGKLQKSSIFFVLVILSLLLISLTTLNTSNAATTLYVNGTSGNDTYDGTSPTWVSGTIGPKKTIQNASNTVDANGTVHVASGTYNEHVTIGKSMTLIGANPVTTILDGTNNGRALTVNLNCNMNITNFTIRNCASTDGGAISSAAGTININNCTLTGNTATNTGGAIFNFVGTTNINNSTLTGNTASKGGAIFNYAGTIKLNNSNVSGNNATSGGAINNLLGTTNFFNSTVSINNATSGGAINNLLGTTNFFNSTVSGNIAAYGGAINNYMGTTNINNTTITGNNATDGGAINNFQGTTNINNTTITGNNATNRGTIFNFLGTINFFNSTVSGNIAAYGGAINNILGTTNLYNSTITGNNATDGGAINNFQGTTNINNTTITGNNATNHGTINNYLSTANINNSTIIENTATKIGGAIFNFVGTTNINNSTIIGNNATNGGAINNYLGTTNINNSTLTGNSATFGGAIFNFGTTNVYNSTLSGNTAMNIGGTVYNLGTLIMHFNRIVNNSPNAIFTYNTIEVQNNWWGSNSNPSSEFAGNGTVNYSPWIYMTLTANQPFILNKTNVTLTASFNNAYDDNKVTPIDPASGHLPNNILVDFTTDLGNYMGTKFISEQTFDGIAAATLTADEGLGTAHISAKLDNQTVNTNVVTKTNILYVNGATGNDTWDGTSPTHISDTVGPKKTIQNSINTLDTSGTVYVASGTYNEHLTISKNIDLIGANRNTTIIDGTNNGRPIYIVPGVNVNITHFTLRNGTSTSGGAIYNGDSTLTITDSTLTGNTATNGGAICNWGTLSITNSTLTSNTASNNGGAIYNSQGNLNITNSILTGNTAPIAGTLINDQGTLNMHFNLLVTNSTTSIYTTTEIDAENNWWGSNLNPASQFTGSGTVNYSPWLYMTLTANPTVIHNGASSILTVSFNNAYNGADITPINPTSGHLPDGSAVTFTTDLGSVGSKTTTKYTSNGEASATFTANEGPGTAHINATMNNQTLNTIVGTETFYVNGATGNDTWDGLSPTHTIGTIGPLKTIQTAINKVRFSGTIYVASGTYNEHLTMDTGNIVLIGSGQNQTFIDGTNNGIVIVNAGSFTVNITGVTIRNGNATDGGAIFNRGTLTITNSTLTGNIASYRGGAIYNYLGTLNIINSVLNGNNNPTGIGGAIFNDGTTNIVNSILSGNNATVGGAIYNPTNTSISISNSNINGNTANIGGAIYNCEGIVYVTESTLTGNTANYYGSVIYNSNGEAVSLIFNRISGNSPNTIWTDAVINAENNWWGSNSNPNSQFTGYVLYMPWIYMTLTSDPTLILDGTTSTLTASFNNLYDGELYVTPINPAVGHLPDNSVVTFTTDLGSVGSPTTTKNTSNGIATATLTADTGIGTANITAQLDNQTLPTTVVITDTLYVNGATGDDKYDGLNPTFISGTKTGPKQTITNALETLNTAGITGTINVASGTYTENLEIETNVNLMGNNTNNTIITTSDPNNNIITIGKIKKALITGFTLQGATNGIGVLINGGEITIQNNNIINNDVGISIGMELKPSTITQNNIKYNNIGIGTLSDVNINYNSLLENNIDIDSHFEDPINATHNWWGSNSEPIGRTEGSIEYNPWLVLTVNATPTLIKKDATSNITADLNHDSDGNPVTGHIMDGTLITFTTTLGTITSPKYTQNGTLKTTLDGGKISGTADITTTLDNEEIHTPVTVDATTPTVTSTNPAQYAVNLPSNQVFTVTFSEAIKAANLNLVVLKTSTGTLIATTKTITGNVLTITPTSALSEAKYLLLLYAGCVTDLVGNPSVALSRTYGVGAQPYVTSTDPVNYALNVARNKVITATFNEPIVAKYLTLIYLKTVTGGIQIATTKSVSGNTLTITPTTPLAANTRYMVLIYTFAVTDMAGNSNVNKQFTFTTGAT